METIQLNSVRRLQQLTDFNALLAQANAALATVEDEEQLLQDICDLAIRHAHFELALIARPDPSGWFQIPVSAGATSFLEGQRTSFDPDRPEGRGSFAKVWREEQAVFIDDSIANPQLGFWRDRYRSHGFKSTAVLPIRRDGQLWGLFALFHAQINVFDDDFKALLTELALDISRGLDRIDAQNLQNALLYNSVVGIILVKGRTIQKTNLRTAQMFGYPPEDMVGQTTGLFYADEREWMEKSDIYSAFQTQNEVKIEAIRMLRKDGSILIGDVSGILVDPQKDLSVWTIEDVTERERNKQRVQRLSDFNGLLSESNKIIARATDESQMLQSLCELAIRCTRLSLAWIGWPDDDGWFQPFAAAGAVEYLTDIRISALPDIPEGQGPAGNAWRSRIPVYTHSFPENPFATPWAERARIFGLRASASLPIYRDGRLWAVFHLYHNETDIFDADLQHVLTDLAQDVGYGLDRLDLSRRERETSAFNEALLNSLTAGVHVMRYPERIFEQANTRMLEMTGADSMDELLGSHCRRFYLDDETYSQVGELARQILREGHGTLSEVPYRRLDGEIIYIDLSGQKMSQADGVDRIVWTQIDATKRNANEQTIRALSAARATLLANTTAGIDLVRYPERVFVEVNQGFLDILGLDSPEEAIGHTVNEIYPNSSENQRMAELSRNILANGHGSLRDLAVVRKDGRTVHVDVSGQRLDGEDPEHPVIVWTSVDVTERHRLTEELARQAHIDALTGLPNRRALGKEFEKAMARAKRHNRLLGVVMMDLDNFKRVNDTYGHTVGDKVLRVIGQRLQETLRRTDFVARMGGDEFILLIEDCSDLDEIRAVLDKIGQVVHEPISLKNGGKVSLKLSGGVCLYPGIDTENPNVLLQHSDLALYKNKAHKEDRLRFWTLYGEDTPRQRTRVQHLLYGGGLRIFYQPILDNRSRRIVGAEALARLQDNDGTILSPATFLPKLETDDLFELSFKVLGQTLQDLYLLDQKGFPLWVSVNVDPRNISAAFVARLQNLLAEVKIAPERIYLEILEGGTFTEHQLALEHLHALKALGVRLALDDVGSAYSSLLRLKELPIDKVKLDQGFVRTLEERPQDLQFVEAILDLANGLGRELVVEGVETDDILDAMSVLGVPAMQGYGIAPPLPFARLQELVRQPPSRHRQHPTSLMGIYAKLLSNHSSRKKAILQNLHLVDHLTLVDHTSCPVHTDLLRLGVLEGDLIHQRHRDYHRAIGDMVDQIATIPSGNDWSAAETAIKSLLEAVIAEYRKNKSIEKNSIPFHLGR